MSNRELDLEWLELIKQALEAGISTQEIREFLDTPSGVMKVE